MSSPIRAGCKRNCFPNCLTLARSMRARTWAKSTYGTHCLSGARSFPGSAPPRALKHDWKIILLPGGQRVYVSCLRGSAASPWRLGLFNTCKRFTRNWREQKYAKNVPRSPKLTSLFHVPATRWLTGWLVGWLAGSKQQKFNTLLKCQMKHVIYHGRALSHSSSGFLLPIPESWVLRVSRAPLLPCIYVATAAEWIYPVRPYLF